MLKGINPILSPELLKTLAEMGHGDEIILADAHFPGHTFCKNIIRYDGIQIPNLLEGILPPLVCIFSICFFVPRKYSNSPPVTLLGSVTNKT